MFFDSKILKTETDENMVIFTVFGLMGQGRIRKFYLGMFEQDFEKFFIFEKQNNNIRLYAKYPKNVFHDFTKHFLYTINNFHIIRNLLVI